MNIASAIAAAETSNECETPCKRPVKLACTLAVLSEISKPVRPSNSPQKVPIIPMPVKIPGRCLKKSAFSGVSTIISARK